MAPLRIAVIPGDGIGWEVVPEAVAVLEEAGRLFELDLAFETFDFGVRRYLRTGQALPEDLDEWVGTLPERFDAALFGAGGLDPRMPADVSAQPLLRALRRGLDLYANVRPCRLLAPGLSPLKHKGPEEVDLVVIRENTEGYDALRATAFREGTEQEMELRMEVNTYNGVRRVLEFAFRYAQDHDRRRVHMAEKGRPQGLWARLFREVSAQYPDIEAVRMHVDTLAYTMVAAPETLEVVVAENRAGDILSDIAAALQGSRGVAPAGCYNPQRCFAYFEPVHGTAPDIVDQGRANPLAAIRAGAMLLDHLGFPRAAAAIEEAAATTVREGHVTPDLGGDLSTQEAGEAVRRALRRTAGADG